MDSSEITIKLGIPIATALVGVWIGYRLGRVGKWHDEYNQIADRLFLKVDVQLSPGHGGYYQMQEDDIKLIRRLMTRRQTRKFDAAIERFNQAASNCEDDNAGHYQYADVDSVNDALAEIAALLKRRR